MNGVLPVDKPVGPTSHDVVATVRRVLGRKVKVGHCGTLDPMASGLMLLTVGPSTRISKFLTGLDKTYRADISFGIGTDTLDADGTVTERADGEVCVDPQALRTAAQGMLGWIQQRVPDYAAVRVDGRRHHERARAGESVPAVERRIRIDRLDVVDHGGACATIEVACSSGTYIRSIARDLGLALGFPAHLTALRRESIGEFSITSSRPPVFHSVSEVTDALIPPAASLTFFPDLVVDASTEEALRKGMCVTVGDDDCSRLRSSESKVRVMSSKGELVCVGEYLDHRAAIQPRVVFPVEGQ